MGVILGIIHYALSALIWIIVFRVILEWLKIGRGTHPIQRLIYEISEPLINPIRNVLPPLGIFDLSPMVAILILELLRRII